MAMAVSRVVADVVWCRTFKLGLSLLIVYDIASLNSFDDAGALF